MVGGWGLSVGVWLTQMIEYNYVTGDRIIFTALEQFSAHLRLRGWSRVIVLSFIPRGCDNLSSCFRGGKADDIFRSDDIVGYLLHRAGATFFHFGTVLQSSRAYL